MVIQTVRFIKYSKAIQLMNLVVTLFSAGGKPRTNLEFLKNKIFRKAVILVTGVFLRNWDLAEQTTMYSSWDGS